MQTGEKRRKKKRKEIYKENRESSCNTIRMQFNMGRLLFLCSKVPSGFFSCSALPALCYPDPAFTFFLLYTKVWESQELICMSHLRTCSYANRAMFRNVYS